MSSLAAYKPELPYAYAPGIFPAAECLLHRPERVKRLLVHSGGGGAGREKLLALARRLHVRVEKADRVLARVSGKENCFAAAVFEKFSDTLLENAPHVVLHRPSDSGNAGTIFRTALGLGVEDVAMIRPCVDPFDPHTVRASMGALFSLRLHVYESFADYRAAYPRHSLFPFMLAGAASLPEVLSTPVPDPWALVFGNEGSGLPPEFGSLGTPVRIPSNSKVDSLNLSVAAAIGIYGFAQQTGIAAAPGRPTKKGEEHG